MRFDDYYCTNEDCGFIVEDYMAESYDKLPQTIKCPKCGSRCKRKISSSIHITDSFKAVNKDVTGATWASEKMKHYHGLRKDKRFY